MSNMSMLDGLRRHHMVALVAKYGAANGRGSPVNFTKAQLLELFMAWYETAPEIQQRDAMQQIVILRSKPQKPAGFALLSPERRAEIAGMGGRTAHQLGRAHRFTPEEAVAAGKKSRSRRFFSAKELK